MNKPIRVLQVFGVMNYGGAENFIMNVFRNVDRSKILFDFVVHSNEEGKFDQEIKELGGTIYKCPRFKGTNYLKYKKWWHLFFKEHPEYSIIHTHIRSTASIFLKIAKKYNLKTISHSHSTSNGKGISSFVKRMLQKNICKYSDLCLACSIEAGKWLFGNKIINSEKFKIIKNGIDLEKYGLNTAVRARIRKEMRVLDEEILLVHVGRFHESKNHDFLLKVFYEISNYSQKYKLLLVGDGELRKHIENQIATYNIQKRVILVGNVSNVNDYLQASDCFVFPSKWEGLPMTVIEAQASGLPCLVSNRITNEVAVTSLVEMLSIDDVSIWTKRIIFNGFEKKDSKSEIIEAGYSINDVCEKLIDAYFSLTKGFLV